MLISLFSVLVLFKIQLFDSGCCEWFNSAEIIFFCYLFSSNSNRVPNSKLYENERNNYVEMMLLKSGKFSSEISENGRLSC